MNLRRIALLVCFLCVSAFLDHCLAQNYAPAANFSTQTLPEAVAKGDFNNDGNLDVVVANAGSASLSLFPGGGDGTFGPPITIPVSPDPNSQPISVAAADFNGDGNLDLAVSFALSSSIQVLLGNGDGTFQPPVALGIPGLGQFPVVIQVTAVDLNYDHKPDLAAATSNGVAIFLNDGAGNFTLQGNAFPGQIIQNFVVADFNHDQRPDLAATAISGSPDITGTVLLSLGNGDGTFQSPVSLPLSTHVPAGIAAADLNGDGLVDLIVSDFGSVNLMALANGAITIALQRPDGTFLPSATLPGIIHPGPVMVADFNGDGNPDIATLSGSGPSEPSAVLIYLGQGNAAFSPPNQFAVLSAPTAFLAGSFTNTNALDIVTADLRANAISVLVNRGAVSLRLSSSVNPSLVAQPVILTATAQPKFPGVGTLSGSVIFADGANTLGVASVNSSGIASVTTSFSSRGNHSLTAVYGGNSSFVGGASATLNQVVNLAQPSVTLGSSVDPSQVGQPVTFLVTVSAIGTGPVPTGNVSLTSGGVVILSGAVDSTGKVSLSTSSLAAGTDIIAAQYAGDANYGAANSSPLTQTVNLNADTTALTVSPNPSAFGQAVSLTATVTASGGISATPSGTVTFSGGGNSLGSATLDNAGRASITFSTLTPGSYSIVASYSGDTRFSPSTSAANSLTVNKGPTTTTLAGTPNPSAFGQAVILAATVTGAAGTGTPTGAVTFSDGATAIGTATLNQGKAALNVNSLKAGTHTLTASYAGDTNFANSASAAISQTVNKTSTTTTLAGTPNPSVFGQPVTFTATVVASGGGAGTPSGSVTLSDGGNSLGTATLNQGKVSLTVTSLTPGSHTNSASYTGDVNFLPSSASGAAGVTQVVGQSSTVTILSSSANPSVYGQVVKFSAAVTPAGGGGGIPSGTLMFNDGNSLLGTVSLDNAGKAAISVGSLGIGSHSITASYSGSTGYLASASGAFSQIVNRDSVVLTLTSAPNPSTVGQAVAFTIQVAAAQPGGSAGTASPSGTVILSDGSAVLGNVMLDNTGKAAISIANLASGSHSLTAAYQEDANFSPGTSGSYTQTVNKISSSITLSSSQNPTTNASALTLTATVRTSAAGAPTGTVTLLDGSQQVSSSTVTSAGIATLSLSSLSTGNHNFSVAYSGDSTFAAAQSTPLDEVVVDSHSKIALTSSANPVTVSTAVTFAATVTPALGGAVNSGFVVFIDGQQTLASVPVANSKATFTTVSLPVGQQPILATYQAASSPGPFDGTSSVLLETVNPGKSDFSLSILPATGQIKAGDIFRAQLTLTPLNGLIGPVTTFCAGAPVGSTCTVVPPSGKFDGKTSVTAAIVITTTGSESSSIGSVREEGRPIPPFTGMALTLLPTALGCLLISVSPRKRRGLFAMALLAGLLTGCGGGSYSPPKPVRTPPGAYTITIRSQSGSLTHSGSVHLTVK
jgi:hypothetical protein